MSLVPVETAQEDLLSRRMAALGIKETDLEESFVRSGGHGGQNVNKVSTCVILSHRPSGIQVRCQESRQQGANRVAARMLLLDKIETARNAAAAQQRALKEKARRRNRPRSFGAKQRILASKARQSDKKRARRFQGDD
jgi:peptide chain release factor